MIKKNNKGLTLIEILVSSVITVIVIMYGATFFISSWRLEVDSEEYNKVLQYAANIIEEAKLVPTKVIVFNNNYDGDRLDYLILSSHPVGDYSNVANGTTPKKFGPKEAYLYFGKDVKSIKINRTVYFGTAIDGGAIPMSVLLEWKSSKEKIEKIVVNTYLGVSNNERKMNAV